MKIDTIDRLSNTLAEIAAHGDRATFYHTEAWIQSLLHAYPALRFRALVAGGTTPVAFLPFFVSRRGLAQVYWSLPFGTYGGPVAIDDDTAATSLSKMFLDFRNDPGIHEIGLVDYDNRFTMPEFEVEHADTHILDLKPGFDVIWRHFEKSKRRQARKAEREGIIVKLAQSVDDMRQYYQIYEQRIEHWHHSIKYPESFFIRLFEAGPEKVRLFLARREGDLLGGHLNFYHRGTVIAWNGVTREDSRGHQASTALYAACIRDACENGYRSYNLGGSLGKKSLVSYKESLGGVRYEYRILRWRSLRGKIVAAVKKRLPRR